MGKVSVNKKDKIEEKLKKARESVGKLQGVIEKLESEKEKVDGELRLKEGFFRQSVSQTKESGERKYRIYCFLEDDRSHTLLSTDDENLAHSLYKVLKKIENPEIAQLLYTHLNCETKQTVPECLNETRAEVVQIPRRKVATLFGVIKMYKNERGFGFIIDQHSKDFFFNINDCNGLKNPEVGQHVTFEVVGIEQGKNKAFNIRPATEQEWKAFVSGGSR